MNRVKSLLVVGLAVVAFAGIGCNGKDSPTQSPSNNDPGLPPPGGECGATVHCDSLSLGERGPENHETLAGTSWKLVEVSIVKDNVYPAEIIDYSDKNIVYEFKGNDKLVVSGKTDDLLVFDDFKEGEHVYEYSNIVGAPNLRIDNPKFGSGERTFFAVWNLNNDDELGIVGYTCVGCVQHESGLREEGSHYQWGKTFTKLKK